MPFLWRKKKDDTTKNPSMKTAEKGEDKSIKSQPVKAYKSDNGPRPEWVRQWKV